MMNNKNTMKTFTLLFLLVGTNVSFADNGEYMQNCASLEKVIKQNFQSLPFPLNQIGKDKFDISSDEINQLEDLEGYDIQDIKMEEWKLSNDKELIKDIFDKIHEEQTLMYDQTNKGLYGSVKFNNEDLEINHEEYTGSLEFNLTEINQLVILAKYKDEDIDDESSQLNNIILEDAFSNQLHEVDFSFYNHAIIKNYQESCSGLDGLEQLYFSLESAGAW